MLAACSFPLGGSDEAPVVPAPAPVSSAPLAPLDGDDDAAKTAQETALLLSQGGAAQSDQPADAGISDENDFDAVAERETIESDAERLARMRAQYQQVAPRALPTRDGAEQPNIVAFALATSNPIGERIYPRLGLNILARHERNCRSYASADQAQLDFLARGGPQTDRRGLDPDGDGYACDWDPARYRKVQVD
jgi:hypothetical protein